MAITTHYSQCPGARESIDAGALLAHNGKVAVYSQYFPIEFWVFACEAADSIVSLWKPRQPHKALNYLSPRFVVKTTHRKHFAHIGFPEESEKFCTLNDLSFMNKHLRALSKNEGILLANCPKLPGTYDISWLPLT